MVEVMTHLSTIGARSGQVLVRTEPLLFSADGPTVILIEVDPEWNEEQDTVTDVHIRVTAGGFPEEHEQDGVVVILRNVLEILEDNNVIEAEA